MLSLFSCLLAMAHAASLPGLPLEFEKGASQTWVLSGQLPPEFANAGVEPGWTLLEVDGLKLTDFELARRRMATGPARAAQLLFATPKGETVLEVQRKVLVQAEQLGVVPFPEGFVAGAGHWRVDRAGNPVRMDAAGTPWRFDAPSGGLVKATSVPKVDLEIPELWWTLVDADWAVLAPSALEVGSAAEVHARFPNSARALSFQGKSGDHLLVIAEDGVEVWSVGWPNGTPQLPECGADFPESCLVAGRQVLANFGGRPGGREAALQRYKMSCEGGVYRACLEAIGLEQADLSGRATACMDKDVRACHEIAKLRLDIDGEQPGAFTMGALEFACSTDASGSLGERLRRLEDVGEGCMMLSSAFDRLKVADRALLSLDQACVLGRAAACDEATRRREEAFALRTVRECEDVNLPLATACVQLGHMLQERTIQATKLDGFGAWLRACKLGDDEGCSLLGDYVDRWGIEHPRVVEAEDELLDACGKGEPKACVGAGHLLVRHEPRSEAYGRALTLFVGACDSGLPQGCIAGAEQRRIGSTRDLELPDQRTLWEKACSLESPEGCAGFGAVLARDRDEWGAAFTAWSKACATGESSACTDLGELVTRKHEVAWPAELPSREYYSQGCEFGDPEGCFGLAQLDMPKKEDPSEPVYVLLERSCEGDFGTGCAELGRIHLARKTSFDDELAADHLEAACDNGHFDSCKALGEMYQKGKGVEKDRLRARELAQRYSVNARRRHVRVGAHLGFPYVAGPEAELVAPIPVGPAIAITGSYSYLPQLGGALVQLKGESYPDNPPDLQYLDAGVRLYGNNKARGLYGMVGWHQLQASGGDVQQPLIRNGFSARFGMHLENRFLYSRVEMGLGQYGVVYMRDFDEDETGSFPLIQATLGLSFGFSVL